MERTMNLNICNNCGGDFEYRHGRWICRSCGSYKPEELSNEEVTLLYTASQKLRLAEFDEAELEFDDIVRKYPQNPCGYWGRLMSRYGIKYEEDFDGRRIPTCYATSIESILSDPDYKKAHECADKETKEYYARQAEYIERVRKEWVEKARKEKPYDIFICYKDSDLANGIERTEDSITAQDLYIHLTNKGYRVFYSHESLRDKVGEKYEPYIFNALSTAKVMLVYGSKPEYITSTWLKNEWTRYEKRIKAGEKKPNSLLVACDGFSPAQLPKALASRQCFDATQRSFYFDLIEAVERIFKEDNTTATAPALSPVPVRKRGKLAPVIAVCATIAVVAIAAAAIGIGQSRKEPILPPVETPTATEVMDTEESKDTTSTTTPGTSATSGSECAHVAVIDQAIAPTCTEDGCTEGAHCLYCSEILSVQETLPAPGHTEVTDEAVEATCTRAGRTEGSHCTACGETLVKATYIAPKGHTYVGGTCSTCGAQEVVVDQSLFGFTELEDGTYSVLARDPESISGHVVIPDMYNGKLVTQIENKGFYQCEKITSITLPDSIISIGDSAFAYCSGLTSIALPNGVTSIGGGAFYNCKNLTSIALPDSVTSIGANTFYGCQALTSITIPDSVTSIGGGAFYGCQALTSIDIPNGVTSIGGSAFQDCENLTSITIPDGVTSIGAETFYGCQALTSIDIPNGVTSIGDSAFDRCSSLTGIIIPEGVTRIGDSVFEYCVSLRSVVIPEGVTSIGKKAFFDCELLSSLTIPSSVTKIESEAFCYCLGLRSLSFAGTMEQWSEISLGNKWTGEAAHGYYASSKVPATEIVCSDGTVSLN